MRLSKPTNYLDARTILTSCPALWGCERTRRGPSTRPRPERAASGPESKGSRPVAARTSPRSSPGCATDARRRSIRERRIRKPFPARRPDPVGARLDPVGAGKVAIDSSVSGASKLAGHRSGLSSARGAARSRRTKQSLSKMHIPTRYTTRADEAYGSKSRCVFRPRRRICRWIPPAPCAVVISRAHARDGRMAG